MHSLSFMAARVASYELSHGLHHLDSFVYCSEIGSFFHLDLVSDLLQINDFLQLVTAANQLVGSLLETVICLKVVFA